MAFDALTSHYWAPIQPLLALPAVADIFVDRYDRIYTSAAGQYQDHDLRWPDEAALAGAIANLATSQNGVVWNPEKPILDTRLPDGSRVNASCPPLAQWSQATIRVARPQQWSLDELCAGGMMPPRFCAYLREAVVRRANVVICGAVGSGKTTLLRALAQLRIDAGHRIFLIEDTAELRLVLRRGIAHEITAGNSAALNMVDSLYAALRSAPDCLIVGEIRKPDALHAFLEILEAGFRGALATMHAASAAGLLVRMENILQRTGLFAMPEPYERMVRGNLDVVVHCSCEGGRFRVTDVIELNGLEPVPLLRYLQDAWVGPLAF